MVHVAVGARSGRLHTELVAVGGGAHNVRSGPPRAVARISMDRCEFGDVREQAGVEVHRPATEKTVVQAPQVADLDGPQAVQLGAQQSGERINALVGACR